MVNIICFLVMFSSNIFLSLDIGCYESSFYKLFLKKPYLVIWKSHWKSHGNLFVWKCGKPGTKYIIYFINFIPDILYFIMEKIIMFLSENVGTVDLCITLCSLNASKYIIFNLIFIYILYFIKEKSW